MVRSGFREYEEGKLRCPACCRQENATFSPYIHRTWDPPFWPSLYYVLRSSKFRGHGKEEEDMQRAGLFLRRIPFRFLFDLSCHMTFEALFIPTAEKVAAHLFRRLALCLGHRQEDEHGRAHRQGREEEVKAWKMDSTLANDS